MNVWNIAVRADVGEPVRSCAKASRSLCRMFPSVIMSRFDIGQRRDPGQPLPKTVLCLEEARTISQSCGEKPPSMRFARWYLTSLKKGAAADSIVLCSLAFLWIAFVGLLATHDINAISFKTYQYNLTLYLTALGVVMAVAVAGVLLRYRPDRPIGFLAEMLVSTKLADRLVSGIPMFLALIIFLPVFSTMKSAIPLFNAYTWDHSFIGIDRAVHGTDPWRILQPIVGYPLVTSILSMLYHLWILLIYVGAIYFCFFQKSVALRTRFFLAYFACWTILGIGMATALASVGPCFVAPLLGEHYFDEQLNYLRSANEIFPVMVLPVQDALAAAFRSTETGLGHGVSAMPSMHVSIAFLFFLAMREVSRGGGIFFGVFFLITFLGSIHLAYHYAVDGYASILGTWLIWIVSGRITRLLSPRSQLA